MACKKHNYKGNKPCKVCKEQNAPWMFAFWIFVACMAVAYWYIAIPMLIAYFVISELKE